MPRLTVSQRLRGQLRKLLKHGDQSALSKFSHERPGGAKIQQQELSYFLNNTPGRTGLKIDDLDDIAAYLRVSIAELVGETRAADLSANEQRMIYAFRAMPPAVQEHFLAVIEQASLAPRQYGRTSPLTTASRVINPLRTAQTVADSDTSTSSTSSTGGPYGRPVSSDPSAALEELRRYLNEVIAELGSAAAGQIPGRPLPNSRHEEPNAGRMAD